MWENIYIYIEKKATSRYSQHFLSIVSFIESIFFPIPPDVILIPIIHFNQKKFLYSVINCTFFSILGGAIGYLVGFYIFDLVSNFFDLNKQKTFINYYNELGMVAVFLGGFTPIPYKIIALTSGYAKFNFIYFILLSALSRGMRFFIIGYIIKRYGDIGLLILKKYKYLFFFILPIVIIASLYIIINHA